MSKGPVCMPLSDAVFCLDCEKLSNSDGTCCVCGSTALRSVANWLGTLGAPETRAVIVEPVTARELAREAIAKRNQQLRDDYEYAELLRYISPLPKEDAHVV